MKSEILKVNVPTPVAEAVVGLLAPHTEVKTIADLNRALIKNESNDILDQQEAEAYTRLSYWTLQRAEKEKTLRVLRAGRKRLYRKSALDAFLEGK